MITVPRAGRLLLAPPRAPPDWGQSDWGPSDWGPRHPVHLGGKAIAAAGYVGYIPCVRLRFAKRLAQVLDVEAQAAFLDIHVGPHSCKQRSIWDDFTGALDKGDEKVESPAAETHGASLFLQSAFRREETEWAECEHRVPVVEHSQSLKMPRSQVTSSANRLVPGNGWVVPNWGHLPAGDQVDDCSGLVTARSRRIISVE
jgi:hypothetical protein